MSKFFRILFILSAIFISFTAVSSDIGQGNPEINVKNKNEVFIFGEWKKTTGTIQDMVQGDRACYIDLLDDLGIKFTELAHFDLCSDAGMRGKKVQLIYEQGKVHAASCQGNMDCEESDTVLLIKELTPVE